MAFKSRDRIRWNRISWSADRRASTGRWWRGSGCRPAPACHRFRAPPRNGGRAVLVTADIRDAASTVSVVQSCDAIVNAVGLYIEQGDATFQSVHVDGAARLAMTASQAGVSRLIHISGIGADPRSASDYVRARADGESRVLAAFPNATIIRPSVMFGPGDSFFNALDRIARFAPIIPLFGVGATYLQPVFVDDVAEAVARALMDLATMGQIIELGGPQAYTYRSLIEFVLAQKGRRRLLSRCRFLSGMSWRASAPSCRHRR